MNTKVKVGIAAAILAALVALVVLDHQTTPKEEVATKNGAPTEAITVVGNGAAPPSTRLGEEEINTILQNAQKQFAQPKPPSTGPGIKSAEEKNEKRITSSGDEYVINEGDTFETIAQKKLGSKTFAHLIAEANPDVKPTALRVGKTIKLPGKPEKKEEAVAKAPEVVAPPPVEVARKPALETVGAQKVYTVQSGDTLSGISAKVYNTSRHYQKIYEANKDVIGDPNTLQVGSKLVMPDLPSKSATPNGASAGAVATTNPAPVTAPAGAKLVQVSEGASLWKIAEKLAAEKKIGIHDMMKAIVAANPDKLKDEGTLLRLGWQLIIPE